jgi:phosphate transport system substrate-binding protein
VRAALRGYVVAAALACATSACAGELAAYSPQQQVRGDIRIWGSPEDAPLIALWEQGFRRQQPDARVVAELHGPESTIASLYTDMADIAFVGRELRVPVENMAFQWVKLYAPTTIEVANGSVGSDRLAGSIAVFVHPQNPLQGLTLAQLDGIFGAQHRRGGRNLRTWGDVGLGGEWSSKPIHVAAPAVDSIPALYFRHAVLDDSFKWNAALKEFPSDADAIAAVARDPSAIAYGRIGVAPQGVKAVPLAAKPGAPFVALTAQTAAERSYPLVRPVVVAVDRTAGKPLDPKVREFMRFVLSADGQAAIARDGAYVPLQSAAAQRQLQRLD